MPSYDIAFDIGGMRFRAGLVDENGRVSQQVTFDSPALPAETIEHIRRIVASYAVSAAEARVGIAIGGMVERTGLVTSGGLNFMDVPLAERLALGRPLVILNDAKAAALAEAVYNPRLADHKSFVLITASAGIGGGVIVNGELYEGHTGTAGEVGHMVINRALDAYCRLGHRGCLDSLASARAVNNRLGKLWREGHWRQHENGVTIRDLGHLLAENDGMAHTLVNEVGTWLGEGVMKIIRVLDPCEVVFKGYLMTTLWAHLHPRMTDVLAAYDKEIPLSLSALGEDVGLVGAAVAARRAHPRA